MRRRDLACWEGRDWLWSWELAFWDAAWGKEPSPSPWLLYVINARPAVLSVFSAGEAGRSCRAGSLLALGQGTVCIGRDELLRWSEKVNGKTGNLSYGQWEGEVSCVLRALEVELGYEENKRLRKIVIISFNSSSYFWWIFSIILLNSFCFYFLLFSFSHVFSLLSLA